MPIYVDYNAETADGRFFVRQARLPEPVEVGQVLQTHDDDGNALVVEVDDVDRESGLVYLRPDWSTWVDADTPRFVAARLVSVAAGLRQPAGPEHSLRPAGISIGLSNLEIRTTEDDATRTILVRPRPSLPA